MRGRAYLMALQSCEGATLKDLDWVLSDIINGDPEPMKFAPTSGKLARMVRDQAAKRRWEGEGAPPEPTKAIEQGLSPEEQKQRQEGLEKLSGLMAPVKRKRFDYQVWVAERVKAGTITLHPGAEGRNATPDQT